MSPVKTVYVPRFGSQLGSSQRDESRPVQSMDETEPPSQGQRGNKRGISNIKGENSRSTLKVKLPKLNKKVSKEDKTPRGLMFEAAADKAETTVSRGGETQSAGNDSVAVGGDVFFFSQRPTSKGIHAKEKAKLAVLRTISKMLDENQLIRQRLVALSQGN